jgi:hypothetical protein
MVHSPGKPANFRKLLEKCTMVQASRKFNNVGKNPKLFTMVHFLRKSVNFIKSAQWRNFFKYLSEFKKNCTMVHFPRKPAKIRKYGKSALWRI